METLISFQSVPAVPITAAFDQSFRAVDLFFDEDFVIEKEADADDGKNDVNFGTENAGLFKDSFVG